MSGGGVVTDVHAVPEVDASIEFILDPAVESAVAFGAMAEKEPKRRAFAGAVPIPAAIAAAAGNGSAGFRTAGEYTYGGGGGIAPKRESELDPRIGCGTGAITAIPAALAGRGRDSGLMNVGYLY